MEDSVGDLFGTISTSPETALYHYATPHNYTINEFPEEYRDFMPSVFYPSPWKGGWWRLKDAVDYIVTFSKSTLHTAARLGAPRGLVSSGASGRQQRRENPG